MFLPSYQQPYFVCLQPLDSFGDGAVFDTSHALEVMDMSVLFNDEIIRLKNLVEDILTGKENVACSILSFKITIFLSCS